MQTYRDLIELARVSREARATKDPDVAAELRRMAREYQERASKLNARQVPALDHS